MPSKRFASAAVLVVALAATATACGGSEKKSASPVSAAPTSPSAAPAAPSAPASSPAAQGLAVDSLSAADIAKQAQAAMAALTSVKVQGTVTDESGVTKVLMAADKKGNCVGSVALPGTGQVDILRTSTQVWLKPGAMFWTTIGAQKGGAKAGAKAAEMFKDRYLTGGENDKTLQQATSTCELVDAIAKDGNVANTYTKGAVTTVTGVKAIALTATDAEGVESRMYIATEGKPYLVMVERADSPQANHMVLSDFDKPLTVQAPPADTVVDFTAFQDRLKTT